MAGGVSLPSALVNGRGQFRMNAGTAQITEKAVFGVQGKTNRLDDRQL